MTVSSFEAIVKALDLHRVRFIMADGLALVAHGYPISLAPRSAVSGSSRRG